MMAGDRCDAVVDGLSRHLIRDVVEIEVTRLPLWADLYPFQPGVVELVRGLEKGYFWGMEENRVWDPSDRRGSSRLFLLYFSVI
jgi:hypothetical protein